MWPDSFWLLNILNELHVPALALNSPTQPLGKELCPNCHVPLVLSLVPFHYSSFPSRAFSIPGARTKGTITLKDHSKL